MSGRENVRWQGSLGNIPASLICRMSFVKQSGFGYTMKKMHFAGGTMLPSRLDGRGHDVLREVKITRDYIKYAEGVCAN